MDIQIHGRNMRVTEKLADDTRHKLDRLERYLPNIQDVHLELTHQNTRRGSDVIVAQLTVRHSRGAILRVEERGTEGDLSGLVGRVIDNMYRRIERFKGRAARKGGSKIGERFVATEAELATSEEIPAAEFSEMPEAEPEMAVDLDVTRRKVLALTPMTDQEAIQQMELLGHTFFVYCNAADGAINVLYRRTEGDYGVLVPTLENVPA
jgi:putative sigma-54 modulation protein